MAVTSSSATWHQYQVSDLTATSVPLTLASVARMLTSSWLPVSWCGLSISLRLFTATTHSILARPLITSPTCTVHY